MPATIMTLEAIDFKPKGFSGVAVALGNSQVQIYKEKYLTDVIHTEDVVTGLRFGHFAREDGTLVMTTRCVNLFQIFSLETSFCVKFMKIMDTSILLASIRIHICSYICKTDYNTAS